MPAAPPRVLVLSAAIGEGHDLPARQLVADLLERRPDAYAPIVDGLQAMGGLLERVIMGGSSFHSAWGNRAFDVGYALAFHVPPTRRLTNRMMELLGSRGLLAAIARERPDAIVSTYPGTTEVLGRLRRGGRLTVPVVSAITDLAALRTWAHPGVDLHLVTHPESDAEVRAIAGADARVVPVRGLDDPRFAAPPAREDARRELELPLGARVVVVSGGGWGVGDLGGAVDAALALGGTFVIVMCGRNELLRDRLALRFAGNERVRPIGFTTQVPDLFAAADVLVHSTAGLTVLEAAVLGCPVISYGWGRGHIRANNRGYVEHGIADVARSRPELAAALRRALARRRSPDPAYARLPLAADVVLGLLDEAGPRAAGTAGATGDRGPAGASAAAGPTAGVLAAGSRAGDGA
jgi:processive 1,2-diacylglycerol beta-glucosyltransferase